MDFQELLIKVARILEGLKITYAVTGGYAVSVWGRVRSTLDIDVIIQISRIQISALQKALKQISELSYIDEGTMVEALEREGEFNFIHGESGIKIDFFVTGRSESAKLEFERRIPKTIGDQTVYFLSPEDLVLSKLRWYKESESMKQLEDIESVLAIQKDLDKGYIKKWATNQGTIETLNSLLNEKHGK